MSFRASSSLRNVYATAWDADEESTESGLNRNHNTYAINTQTHADYDSDNVDSEAEYATGNDTDTDTDAETGGRRTESGGSGSGSGGVRRRATATARVSHGKKEEKSGLATHRDSRSCSRRVRASRPPQPARRLHQLPPPPPLRARTRWVLNDAPAVIDINQHPIQIQVPLRQQRQPQNNQLPPEHDQQQPQQQQQQASTLPVPEQLLPAFALLPVQYGQEIRCKIHRKKAFKKNSSSNSDNNTNSKKKKKSNPCYELFIEDGERLVFLLSARKLNYVSNSSHYAISSERLVNWSKNSIIANVRSNFIGTAFTIYDNANGTSKQSFGSHEEFAAVQYEPNILGVKGPRRMTVILPAMASRGKRRQLVPENEKDTLLLRSRRGNDKDIHVMYNKTPQWNPETESFVLNFNTRVTMASVKNFQIVHDHDLDYIMMQFGRIGADRFTMDYKYPMTAVQAFGIALTSFDAKLACE
ncbi:hypothetical protein HK100_003408 [Physocladia obscura]|uniref:Tubby C-terminal domain-containing protein n=1 Tax=Physocladia obscura TaxID=109957 RepID=A0AAD5TCQ8_9FUNG|nr:hypothetical protein HK100_003408 [Physocladia obscura]